MARNSLAEPLGALDAKVRQGLRSWPRRLHTELKMTTILVTHDQEEASEVFHSPASEFVMDFLGNVNVSRSRVEQGRAVWGSGTVDVPDLMSRSSRQANVYIRPHELKLSRSLNGTAGIAVRVNRIDPARSYAKVVETPSEGADIQVDLPFEQFLALKLECGDKAYVTPQKVRVFSPEYEI